MTSAAPIPGGHETALLAARRDVAAPSKEGDSFSRAMRAAGAKGDRDALLQAATEFVSTAFIRPILSRMHEAPMGPKSGPFAPGSAEKRFRPLLDQHMADRITKAA